MFATKAPLLRHFLSMDALEKNTIDYLLNASESMLQLMDHPDKKPNVLENRVVANLFFEPSTRTRNSFNIAAQKLGAIVLNPDMKKSSTVKGETLLDTIHTLEAMGTNIIIIRHSDNNTAQFVASELKTQAAVINAGDGMNQHPTQALLDLLTIRQHKQALSDLTVAIIGDIAHSRVARSFIQGLHIMGNNDVRLIAPKAFVPEDINKLNVQVYHSLEEGLNEADVVMALRIQKERLTDDTIPDEKHFFEFYGLTPKTIAYAKPDAIVMHPGPMNRGVEISSAVADGPQSVIFQQVKNGVAVRMAIMETIANSDIFP